jgi:hypothetical protein
MKATSTLNMPARFEKAHVFNSEKLLNIRLQQRVAGRLLIKSSQQAKTVESRSSCSNLSEKQKRMRQVINRKFV